MTMLIWITLGWLLMAIAWIPSVRMMRARRQNQFLGCVFWVLLLAFLWAAGRGINGTAYTFDPQPWIFDLGTAITHLGECPMAAVVLYTAAIYDGRYKFYDNRVIRWLLFAPAVLFTLLALLNPLTHWYYTGVYMTMQHQWLDLVFTVWSYALFILAAVFAFQARWDTVHGRSLLWMVCMLPPLVSDMLGNFMGNHLRTFSALGYFLLVAGLYLHIYLLGLFSIHSTAANDARVVAKIIYERDWNRVMQALARQTGDALRSLSEHIAGALKSPTETQLARLTDECSTIVNQMRSAIHGYHYQLSSLQPGEKTNDDKPDDDPATYLALLDYPVLVTNLMYQVNVSNYNFQQLFPAIKHGRDVRIWFKQYPQLRRLYEVDEGSYEVMLDRGNIVETLDAYVAFIRAGRDHHPIGRCLILAPRESAFSETNLPHWSGAKPGLMESILARPEDDPTIYTWAFRAARYQRLNSVLHEIHDSTGHNMVLIWALLKQARSALPYAETAQVKLKSALSFTQVALSELDTVRSNHTLRLSEFLTGYRDTMAKAGFKITEGLINGNDDNGNGDNNGADGGRGGNLEASDGLVFDNALLEDLPDRTAAVVERAVIEATTNAIRHGHATSLDIGFGQAGSQLVVRLKDNGNSQSGPVTEGLGLSGIRNTVQAENGTLTYSSQPTGFEIDLKLPVAV